MVMEPPQLVQSPPAVVFDLDGILANTEDLYDQAGEDVLRRRGKTYDADLRERVMGRPVVDAIKIMIESHSLTDTVDGLMAECGEMLARLIDSSLAPMPSAIALIDNLQSANIPIAVATSATAEYADNVLTRLGLKPKFQFILTSANIQRGKPDPEIYLLAASRLGIGPAQMMVLEDSANGCRAAIAAGAYTVAVPNRHTKNHIFTGVEFIADTLADPRIRQALRLT